MGNWLNVCVLKWLGDFISYAKLAPDQLLQQPGALLGAKTQQRPSRYVASDGAARIIV